MIFQCDPAKPDDTGTARISDVRAAAWTPRPGCRRGLTAIGLLVVAACGPSTKSSIADDATTESKNSSNPAEGTIEEDLAAPFALSELESAVVNIYVDGEFRHPRDEDDGDSYAGSGVVVSAEGLILTNNHVVAGATAITAVLADGSEHTAELLGVSECDDLAALQLPAGDYQSLPIARSLPPLGTEVYSAGYPEPGYNLASVYTLTKGIISSVRADAKTHWAAVGDEIEHDAVIRQGNSGGPLVSTAGEIVGLNYSFDREFGSHYAISLPSKEEVIRRLALGDDVGSLGARLEVVDSDETEAEEDGIWVSSVTGRSTADVLGLEPGDIIVSIDDRPASPDGTLLRYCQLMSESSGNEGLRLTVHRSDTGERLTGVVGGSPLTIEADGQDDDRPVTVDDQNDFTLVIDDSGTIEVEVPSTWTDIDGSPFGSGDRALRAAPDLVRFAEYFGEPGISVEVFSASGRTTRNLVTSTDYSESCEAGEVVTYADSAFFGHQQLWSDCPDDTEILVLGVTSGTADFTARIEVQVVGSSSDEVVSRALRTFYIGDD